MDKRAWAAALKVLNKARGCTLIVDADILVYHVTDQHTREEELFGESLAEDDEEWTLTCDVKRSVEEARDRTEEMIRDLRADGAILCFGSRSNWRKQVMPEYKAARKDRKPVGWNPTRRNLKQWYTTLRIPRLEADDLVSILCTMDDSPTVAVSEDKDFLQIPGLLFNPRKPDEGVIEITEARANFAHAMMTLTGDSTDGYKGCPSIGPVNAERVLLKAEQEKRARWEAIVEAYEKKGLSVKDALMNARVAWIMRWGDWNPNTGAIKLWCPSRRS